MTGSWSLKNVYCHYTPCFFLKHFCAPHYFLLEIISFQNQISFRLRVLNWWICIRVFVNHRLTSEVNFIWPQHIFSMLLTSSDSESGFSLLYQSFWLLSVALVSALIRVRTFWTRFLWVASDSWILYLMCWSIWLFDQSPAHLRKFSLEYHFCFILRYHQNHRNT